MRIRPKSTENEENIFWVTMTDLMTGLVLVFMVLFFWAYMEGQVEKIQEQTAQQSVSEEIKKSLSPKFILIFCTILSDVPKIKILSGKYFIKALSSSVMMRKILQQ